MNRTPRSGLTLLELATVLVILAALAGLVIPVINDRGNEAREAATMASMKQLRDIIQGDYRIHMDGALPRPKVGFASTVNPARTSLQPQLRYLFVNPETETSVQTHNLNSGRGWKGPYISWTGALYKITDGITHSPTGGPPTGPFTTEYGLGDGDDKNQVTAEKSDPTVLDGWGNPIILRDVIYLGNQRIELRSAGRNGLLDLDANPYDGDDLVMPLVFFHN